MLATRAHRRQKKRGGSTSSSSLSACLLMSRLDQSQRVLAMQGTEQGKPSCASWLSTVFSGDHYEHTYSDETEIQCSDRRPSNRLADSYALMAQTHLAHWNVEGPNFFQLHAAFQEAIRGSF